MSDARTDFFDSGAKNAKAPPSRDDFFAGNLKDEDVTPATGRPGFRTGIYEKVGDSLLHAPGAIASGFNRGVASTAGLFADTAQSAVDLLGAGYSSVRSAITGEDPNDLYQVPDRSKLPLTGDWFAQQLDSTPMGPVTQLPNPEDPAARVLYGAAAGVPGAVVGGGGAAPAIAGAAGGGAGAIAAEAGLDPAAQAAASMLAGAGAAKLSTRAPRVVAPTEKPSEPIDQTQAKLNAAASKQSMGAAGAAVDLQKLSPTLRTAVTKAVQKTGGAVNPEVLAREMQAESLPVKVYLSEGQKMGDAREISEERNGRGKTPASVEGFAAQNKALTENLRKFRDTAGENVFSTNQVEHADTLIKRYNDIDDAREANITADYKALKDANGGKFPVDAKALLTDATAALHEGLLFDHAPPAIMKTLDRLAESNSMTFENFESLRTNLARIQRSQTVDGNVQAAAGVIRDSMERLPLAPEAADLKPLADKARASAKERFDALKADPAYDAAVHGKVSPDKFVQRFVIGGDRDKVAMLSKAMEGDETAAQTLEIATLDHLRQAAGIDGGFNGNFKQDGYNKALRNITPKLNYLLKPKLAEHVQNLGDVARYSQFQPEGHYINNSNTHVAAAASDSADILEGAANVKAGGIPVGTWARKYITDRAGRKSAEKMFAPGSGLTRLSDLTKLKEPK